MPDTPSRPFLGPVSGRDLDGVRADPDAVDPMGRRPLEAALITVTLDTVPVVEELCRALMAGGVSVTTDAVESAHDSYNWMGEPMFSREFLTELGHAAPQAENARPKTQEGTP